MAQSEEIDTGVCTVETLDDILTAPSGGFSMLPARPVDEVYPGLFIAEGHIAKNTLTLQRMGITHVVNAAQGKGQYFVNTGIGLYRKAGIKYLGVEAMDITSFKLNKFFYTSADFIDDAVKSGGKVLVNCVQGASRSPTLVIAYFMLKHRMRVQDAVRLVRKGREISPNPGFLQQLCDLNKCLHDKGHFIQEDDVKPAQI